MLKRIPLQNAYGAFILLALIGCDQKPALNPGVVTTTPQKTPAAARPKSTTPLDLTVPEFAAKPVVWIEDAAPTPDVTPAREKAQAACREADALKGAGQRAAAEELYQAAALADPTWGYPLYQSACNYELQGMHDPGMQRLRAAVAAGFDEFPTMAADDELGALRNHTDFPDLLATVRTRYVAHADRFVGQPIAVRPEGTPPAGGWPVMLLLHGYGDTNRNYLDQAELWAGAGFLTVAVPGSIPTGGDGFQWSNASTEPTERDLQTILAAPLLAGKFDPQRIYLMGFSQGAQHAALLTMERPDRYAGVIALSPGGSLAARMLRPKLAAGKRPAKIALIYGEEEGYDALVPFWQKACTASGWPFQTSTHPGGHHFPEDWDERVPKLGAWLGE